MFVEKKKLEAFSWEKQKKTNKLPFAAQPKRFCQIAEIAARKVAFPSGSELLTPVLNSDINWRATSVCRAVSQKKQDFNKPCQRFSVSGRSERLI